MSDRNTKKGFTNLQLVMLVGLYILSCIAAGKVRKWDKAARIKE